MSVLVELVLLAEPLVALPPVVLSLDVALPLVDVWLLLLLIEMLLLLVSVVVVVVVVLIELLLPYPVPLIVPVAADAALKPIKLTRLMAPNTNVTRATIMLFFN